MERQAVSAGISHSFLILSLAGDKVSSLGMQTNVFLPPDDYLCLIFHQSAIPQEETTNMSHPLFFALKKSSKFEE
jgi:hypothetical protein